MTDVERHTSSALLNESIGSKVSPKNNYYTTSSNSKSKSITNTNRPMKGTPTNLNVVDKATLIQMNPDDSESTSMNTKATAVLAVPISAKNAAKYSDPRRMGGKVVKLWRVLLDSGSDGDIVFIQKGSNYVSTKRRISSQRWRTSSGTFHTDKVGDVDILLPEYSNSKYISVKADVVEYDGTRGDQKPTYDLILGVNTMRELGIVLDFDTLKITIDKITLPMRDINSLQRTKDCAKIYENSFFLNYFDTAYEPISTKEMTNRAVEILDAKYEKADLQKIVDEYCSHLTKDQQIQLLRVLEEFEELFDGTLGDWKTSPVQFELKQDAKPYHGKAFPVPFIHKETLMKEVQRLVDLGVLIPQNDSEWGAPTFIIPKKNGTVRFISDFRELNKRIKRKPFPIPKISTVLQELQGFTYATALDLNMGYYTIRLDPDASKLCTIILPWGKYSYARLPMGVAGSPDLFQSKMSALMANLEYVRTYLDDLLILSKGTFDDHLEKMVEVFERLREAGLRVNAAKSTFATDEIEYLGYILSRAGIKPQPEKVQAILAINPPKNVKELRKFLGIVQYYRDLWEKRSEMLAPLTDLVGECGVTKTTKQKGTVKAPWYWDEKHQQAFENVKAMIARIVVLAYPNFKEEFVIYTDASKRQLGAVITQNNRPIAFFSRKLSEAQSKYSVTELELLAMVECLKEFKGMLWGQKITIHTDHVNLMRDALGLSSDRVYRWRLLLEEYAPKIVYIKGEVNTVADAISRLEYNPEINPDRKCFYSDKTKKYLFFGESAVSTDHRCMAITKLLVDYTNVSDEKSNTSHINDVFANRSEEEEYYPLTVSEIAESQQNDTGLQEDLRKSKRHLALRVIEGTEVIVYKGNRLYIPKDLRKRAVVWYHHALQHPGHTRQEETMSATMYWSGIRTDIRKHVKSCVNCQKNKNSSQQYGKLPEKEPATIPWEWLCCDLIGPYTLKGLDGTVVDFMCLTMIDPATGWFEVVELPLTDVVSEKGDVSEKFDKTSARISRLINQCWLSRYPRPRYVIYDNGSEFKLHFERLFDDFGVKRKPTTIRNPQANAILERIHGVLGNMMRTASLDMAETVTEDAVEYFLTDASWAIRSSHHTVLKASPGAAIFGRDMLFNIPFIADWEQIGLRRQARIIKDNKRHNKDRIDFDYTVGQKVLLRQDGINRKAAEKFTGPYEITQVHTNGTVRIQRGTVSERLNIRRIKPFFEKDGEIMQTIKQRKR